MSSVQRHCSILNYINANDPALASLIGELCLSKMFSLKKKTAGITLLRPDAKLLEKIQKLASGDAPEEAVDILQNLVLLDNLQSPMDFDAKKSDIPTYARKKLAVETADKSKVVLTNGTVIVPDKDFRSRSDRSNLNVYIISGMPETDGEADFSNAKPKEKKGGADLLSGEQRAKLFQNIVRSFCVDKRDPAMELLVALHGWASDPESSDASRKQIADVIAAKASLDTLATLAIVLQPYKINPDYISHGAFDEFAKAMNGTDRPNATDKEQFKNLPVYSVRPNAKEHYEKLASGGDKANDKATEAVAAVKIAAQELSRSMGKPNAVSLLANFYSTKASSLLHKLDLPQVSHGTLFAEAELRAVSAMVLENSAPDFDADELNAIYSNYKLDAPYFCNDKELVQGSNLGFYYSTVYLIARSDALLYVAGANGATDDTSRITDDNAYIGLSKCVGTLLESHRSNSQNAIDALASRKW